jgi:FAD/FMN-containing dehydrogenase
MSDLKVKAVGGYRTVEKARLDQLKALLRGELLVPGDGGYDAARQVWNRMVDKRPALIVRCAGAGDVVHSVRFAREHELEVAVRGGGHNIAGRSMCDEGLLIDLSPMKGMRVDPVRRTVQAQNGLRLGEFDREAQAFGLATTLGVFSDTGIAGLTLGGGYGWLNGTCGLACDNVLLADVVTADARLVTASATENEDLLWGIRGAGANFGVVTSLEYQLHPVGPVLGGLVLHPDSRGKEVLRFFHEFSTGCADEVSTLGLLLTAPDGSPAVGIAACYSGPVDHGEQALKAVRTFGPPVADLIAPRSYVEMQSMFDEVGAPGQLNYWKTSLMRELSEAAIETLLEQARRRPTPTCLIYLQQLHGAASRRRPTDSAYPHRFYHYDCGPWAIWQDPADTEKCIRWAKECWEALTPFYEPGVYVNALSDDVEEGERVRAAYGPSYGRLVALKTKYDPTNLFHLNANIKPEVTAV